MIFFLKRELSWLRVFLNVLGRGSSNGCLCLCYVYSAEIYPTVIRNAGIGSSSFWVKQKKCFIQHFVGKLLHDRPALAQ